MSRRTYNEFLDFEEIRAPSEIMFDVEPSAQEYFPKLFNTRKPSKDHFVVYLDVKEYGPDDLRIKTVDGFVVVNGKHSEKKEDHGYVARKFCRRCPLPKGYTTEALLSQYSSDGILTITANLVRIDAGKYDMPVEEEDKSDAEPDQPDTEKESEKKPVKPKQREMVDVWVEVEKSSFGIDSTLEAFLRDFKLEN